MFSRRWGPVLTCEWGPRSLFSFSLRGKNKYNKKRPEKLQNIIYLPGTFTGVCATMYQYLHTQPGGAHKRSQDAPFDHPPPLRLYLPTSTRIGKLESQVGPIRNRWWEEQTAALYNQRRSHSLRRHPSRSLQQRPHLNFSAP